MLSLKWVLFAVQILCVGLLLNNWITYPLPYNVQFRSTQTFPPNHPSPATFNAISLADVDSPIEALAFSESESRIYMSSINGVIYYYDLVEEELKVFANLLPAYPNARPLGLALGGSALLVADATNGLLAIDLRAPAKIKRLTDRVTETESKIQFCNDILLHPANPNLVYITDSSTIPGEDPFYSAMLDFFVGEPSGRVLLYNHTDDTTTELVKDLWFPNGLCITPSNQLLISETFMRRIIAVNLNDLSEPPKILFNNLPFYPGAISIGAQNSYWVAGIHPTEEFLETYVLPYPLLKKWLMHFSPLVHYLMSPPRAIVGKFTNEADLQIFTGPSSARFSGVSSVVEASNKVWFGSLFGYKLTFYPNSFTVDLDRPKPDSSL